MNGNVLKHQDGDEITYRREIGLYEDLDTVISTWEDLSYFSGEDTFEKGEGCNWKETRRIKIEIVISRRHRRTINSEINQLIKMMIHDVENDIKNRKCDPPCSYLETEVDKVSKSIVWGICAELIQDPNANPPYNLPPYRHYICLQFVGTYDITVTCSDKEIA